MFYEGGALKGSIYCTGSGSWEAAQIMLENTAISNYGRRWKIMLGGSSAQNGDLTFQCDNGSAGSASVSPYYRVKFTKHTTSNAVQAAGAYSNASDIRLKNIISPYHNSISTLSVDTTNNSILDKISNLNSYYFNWKTPNEIKPNSISEEEENELKNTEYYSRELLGFVAQELKEVFPEFVYGEESETDVLSIDYAGLGAVVAIEGLKELNIKLENKINQLEQKITLLESKLK